MFVGLGADAAVAAFKIGQIERCLRGLVDALGALSEFTPEASLQCTHCHHLVRHTILWVQSRMEGREVMLGDEPISMRPGICSNPDPAKEIAERPMGTIDIAWYMLAESELMSRTNVGVLDGLYDRLSGGPIPILEIGLRSKSLGIDIEDMDPAGFTSHLLGHIEGMAYLSTHSQETKLEFNIVNPLRRAIPALSPREVEPNFSHLINDALFAYAISCACRQAPEALLALPTALDAQFGEGVIGKAIFSRARSGYDTRPLASFEDALIDTAMAFRRGIHATPLDYCIAGVQFLQQARRSSFRSSLMPIIAAWQRDAWTRIVVSETFRLSQPQRTIPAIKSTLSLAIDNERFLCSLVLATAHATDVELSSDVRAGFENLARP